MMYIDKLSQESEYYEQDTVFSHTDYCFEPINGRGFYAQSYLMEGLDGEEITLLTTFTRFA